MEALKASTVRVSNLTNGRRHQKSYQLAKNVKRILEVIVGLLKDRVKASEEPTNKKCHLEAEYTKLNAENVKLEVENAELLKLLIEEYAENEADIAKLKTDKIAKEIFSEEPMIEYRSPFLNGLELDAFFQKYQIALEVQGAQHRFHSTSWYKDVKKLEDIVNRDRKRSIPEVSAVDVRSLLKQTVQPNNDRVANTSQLTSDLRSGITRWIVMRLWINGNKISKNDLKLMENRAKAIKLPVNLSQIPNKIATGKGFFRFTADQWKNFILVYPTTGSLVAYNGFKSKELFHFRKMFCNELDDTITGSELFPDELLTPINYKLINYYNEAYNDLEVEFILMNYLIEKEIFGLKLISLYANNSHILAKFIQDNNSIDLFSGQVQYYFKHTLRLPTGEHTYRLAYIKWYLPVANHLT
ncbi:hypothetical protein C1645_817809 [Glomus cerebriforme]|uniref:Uncharacterized protein n=1 Tax=Glomus cerebriforme TaxID=658196 RepID=A0A397T8I5_9GLOM|nr:hypothetical protein C1645_817809 [Glomus cerebriforme]